MPVDSISTIAIPRTAEKKAMLLMDRTRLRPQMRSSLAKYTTATAKTLMKPFRSCSSRSRHMKKSRVETFILTLAAKERRIMRDVGL